MQNWFSKVGMAMRRSRVTAPPLHEPQDRESGSASPGMQASPVDETKARERLRAALAENGVLLIDDNALRDMDAAKRAEAHASGSRSSELSATFMLVNNHQQRGDLRTATAYATEMVHLIEEDQADADEEGDEEPPSRAAVQEMVTDLAEDHCHAGNYAEAQILASAAIGLVPNAPKSYYVLGLALRGLGRFDEALSAFDDALALDPSVPVLYTYRAQILGALDRFEEGVDAIDRAIALEPHDAGFRWLRGNLLKELGQHEAAIAEYERVIAGAQQVDRARSMEEDAQSASDDEQGRMFANLATLSRLKSLLELGRIDDVRGDADRLISEADPQVALEAQMLLGEFYESSGRQSDAMDAYTHALAIDYQDAHARVRRARLFLDLGMPDDTVADLAPVVVDQGKATDAIPVLLELLQRTPEHARGRKALGQAYLSTWQPAKAYVAFTAAMVALPDDWELRYGRAMAAITHAPDYDHGPDRDLDPDHNLSPGHEPDEQEAAWNNSLGDERIVEAIEDLITASLNATAPAAEEALRWLVDRAGVLHPDRLAAMGSSSDSRNGELLPVLALLARMQDAAEAGSRRRWREAVDQLAIIRAELANAGMPILAAQADLHLADCYLRLYEIQDSLDHLAAAEQGISLLGMPLDEGAKRRFREIRDRELKQGKQSRIVDLDHLELFQEVDASLRYPLTILRMQAMIRIGDQDHGESDGPALERVFPIMLEYLSKGQVSGREALTVGRLLRDMGRFDQALQIAERLVETTSDAEDLGAAHNLASTVLLRIGDLDSAAKHSRAALKIARRPEDIITITNNLAANYLQRGDPQRALRLLDAHPLPPQLPAQIHFAYLAQRGEALLQLHHFADAQREYTAALAAQERIRAELRSFDDRRQWHAQQILLYEPAVRAAVLNKDSTAAFELVERSKARSLVDQLAAGPALASKEEDSLNEVLGRVADRQTILRRLAAAGDYVDLELVQRFTELGGTPDLVERGEDGSLRLTAERLATETTRTKAAAERIEDQIEESRRKSAQSIVGELLSPDELRALLADTRLGGST